MKVNRPISPILTLKLVAMAMSIEQSETEGQVRNLRSNTYISHGNNLVKIIQVDAEIICLK